MSNSAEPWTAACQAPLSSVISWSLLRFMSFESVMLSNHLILCCRLLFFLFHLSNESALCIRWPKKWSLSNSPPNEYSKLISFRIDWFDFLAVQGSQESSPAPQFTSISLSALSLLYGSALTSVHDYWKNHDSESLSVMSDSLYPHGVQHTSLPCPSLSPRVAQIHVH